MEAFINTYLPCGIIAVTVIICFYQNLIDANRRRESENPNNQVNPRQLETFLFLGIVLGVVLCYAFVPIPVVWGVAIGAVFGLTAGLLKRKKSK